jgi:hypothetical protein
MNRFISQRLRSDALSLEALALRQQITVLKLAASAANAVPSFKRLSLNGSGDLPHIGPQPCRAGSLQIAPQRHTRSIWPQTKNPGQRA